MPVSVKISDLKKEALQDNDLFLKVRLKFVDEAKEEPDELSPYSSTAVELSSINSAILQRDRVIKNHWNFLSGMTESIRLDPTTFFKTYILNEENRKNVAYLTGNGSYSNNQTFFSDKAVSPQITQSLSASQYSIANLDFVNRMAALLYDHWISKLKDFTVSLSVKPVVPSISGDIIFSTKLSTKDQVKKEFGDGSEIFRIGDYSLSSKVTDWTQHIGYFIAAKKDGVSFNNPTANTGTTKTKIDITDKKYLPNHTHDLTAHSHKISVTAKSGQYTVYVSFGKCGSRIESGHKPFLDYMGGGMGGYNPTFVTGNISATVKAGATGDGGGGTTGSYGKGFTLNIEQKYKNVYVWERIV